MSKRPASALLAALWLVLALAACTGPGRQLGTPADFMPLDTGRTWSYAIADGAGRAFRLAAVSKGGDMRSLPGEPRVPFRFVYGTPAGADHDVTKSIYALSRDGPREFYFDAMVWSLWHNPPIPLLPADVAVGSEVRWEGLVEYAADEIQAVATIRVEATEPVDTPAGRREAVRIRTTYGALPVEVRRWFVRDIGLVRMEVRVNGQLRSARLVAPAK
jgi:hypothetical protein